MRADVLVLAAFGLALAVVAFGGPVWAAWAVTTVGLSPVAYAALLPHEHPLRKWADQ